MTLYKWSQTANSNANSDSTINWAEGQPPSSVNDSARGMMAATAKFRDDIAGAIVTTGTSTSYAVSSYQQFDTLAHLHNQVIAFTPHTTNTGAQAFLNVDGLGTKTIRSAPGVDIPAGTLIQGTPYEVVYNNTDGVFYLKGFFGNPYSIPLGATIEYWAGTAPNSSFVFPFGQAISRTTYSALFALIGSSFGAGDGSTTFNLPDLRGRSTSCPDNMGGTTANRLLNGSLAGVRHSVGGAGGEDAHTLAASEIPSITSNVSTSGTLNGSTSNVVTGTITDFLAAGGNPILKPNNSGSAASVTVSGSMSGSATSNNTGGGAHNNMQPTILCNRIMRII
jgi:microcystin-dependent protein